MTSSGLLLGRALRLGVAGLAEDSVHAAAAITIIAGRAILTTMFRTATFALLIGLRRHLDPTHVWRIVGCDDLAIDDHRRPDVEADNVLVETDLRVLRTWIGA
jgi:hypothetical protein